MSIMEIALIIAGAVVLILGYAIPTKKEKQELPLPSVDKEQIKDIVDKEVEGAQRKIGDIVDETITYSMEKTERAMERLSNEKIMAVNEYSDTVLEKINKNHQEVIFLYDMLNDKHENLVSTVSEANKAAKEIKQSVHETEKIIESSSVNEEILESEVQINLDTAEKKEKETEFVPLKLKKAEVIADSVKETKQRTQAKSKKAEKSKSVPEVVYEMPEEGNNNERILSLHKKGKSKTAIAKELGLGVGEVKLVIDLFEQT